MKCKRCKTDNSLDAVFCRKCGGKLENINIMDKYPKYKFVPTNLIDWKKPKLSRLIFVIFIIGCVSSLLAFIFFFFFHHILESAIVSGVLSVLTGIICFMVFRPYPSSSTKNISIYADYIQKYTYTGIFSSRSKPMFRFYVKDNKFGIMDVSHYRVHLNADYDLLSWREKGKFLTAHQGNREFIIDINGKELK